MQLQKISIPTPWKVNGNSEGVGVSKAKILNLRPVWGLTGISRGVGGDSNQKTFRGRGIDILWNNTLLKKLWRVLGI